MKRLVLAAWLCGAPLTPAAACGPEPYQITPGVLIPVVQDGTLPEGVLALFPSRQSAVMRLGVHRDGDRWEIAPSGQLGTLRWHAESSPGQGAVTIWLYGEAEGETHVPLSYRPAGGQPTASKIIALVGPPPPPPPVPTLTVDSDTFTGEVLEGRTFQLRLTVPLPDGHRWEVAEAVSEGWGRSWPLSLVANPAEPGLFTAGAAGEIIRIGLIKRRDGIQLFPDRVAIVLRVNPARRC